MAKRGAAMQLTDRNWDQEEESEEAGQFKVAGDDQLSKRVIKKAKRRAPGSGESTSTFKGFQGFGVPQNSSTPMVNNTASTFTGFKGFGNQSEKKGVVKKQSDSSSERTSDSVYMNQLKRLNEEVCEWIRKHIDENPHVDLTPVFKDYEKHLLNLEKKFPAVTKAGGQNVNVGTNVTSSSTPNVQTVRGPFTSVGIPTANGSTNVNSNKMDAAEAPGSEAEADDVPKTQSQVKSTPEEDAFYSTRCKLFFKRDNDWSELGVGMLSLKKILEKKIQVLVRNDTALGKILLNVCVSEATPASRSGKNNVLLMSVPNPPVFGKEGDNTKPVSYLIRVKTGEGADELLKHLETAED